MGRFAAIELARLGAEILVVGHNEARGNAAVEAMGQGHQADHAGHRPGQGDRPPLLPRRRRRRTVAKVKDGRPSVLDEYKPYLHQRWNEGCANVRQLHAELKERGYKGGYGTIRDYMMPFRESGAAPPAVPGPPKARDLASWILTHPDNLGDDEKGNSPRPGTAARTWTPSPATSPSSLRSSPACTATTSTTGSLPSKPTTCRVP